MNKKEKDLGLFYAGLGTSITGVLGSSMVGALTSFQGGLTALAGGFIVALHLIMNIRDKEKEDNLKFWKEFGLVNFAEKTPKIQEMIPRDFGCTLRITPPIGVTSEEFASRELALSEYFGIKKINTSYRNKNIFLDLYEKELGKSYPYEGPIDTKGILDLVIGRTWGEKLVKVDLINGGDSHVLIGGATKMGKTNLVRLIFLNLALTKKPREVKFHMADLKGSDYNMFKDIPYTVDHIDRAEKALSFLKNLYDEMNERNRVFIEASKSCNNIQKYNELAKKRDDLKPMPYKLILIDEIQELIPKDFKAEWVLLRKLLARGRSTGHHFILTTQRPSADIIEGVIKNNCTVRIALKLADKVNSKIVLDEDGAEKLRPLGNGILKVSLDTTEFQAMFMEEEKIVELLEDITPDKKIEEVSENINLDGVSSVNIFEGDQNANS